jgi:hypothetical protein
MLTWLLYSVYNSENTTSQSKVLIPLAVKAGSCFFNVGIVHHSIERGLYKCFVYAYKIYWCLTPRKMLYGRIYEQENGVSQERSRCKM